MVKKIFLGLTFIALSLSAFSTDLLVRLYADSQLKRVNFKAVSGPYRIFDENTNLLAILEEGDSLDIVSDYRTVRLMKGSKSLGAYHKLSFMGDSLPAMFLLKPERSSAPQRIYDDHLEISSAHHLLKIVNWVDLENYVAGVIQSEVLGSSDDLDFFKIQAIISRTYALNNQLKHHKDGYNLCDCVHCQAYKGRNITPKIQEATKATEGQVLVDHDKKMISASFHSNSGGQTINSEDVWSMPVSYLRTVEDTFSLNMRNSTWQKIYTEDEWFDLLKKHYNYDVKNPKKREKALSFEQPTRCTHFHENIPLKSMRADLGLKSTFFSVSKDGEKVVLKGRGYGHGVGLSQEGAIQMIRRGYSVDDVLKFYYTDVEIVSIDDIATDE